MVRLLKRFTAGMMLATTTVLSVAGNAQILRLSDAIAEANANDLWLQSNRQAQTAMEEQAVSAGALPDPKVSIAVANLPMDTYELNQEPMTQFKLEVTQMFPRGDSRELKQQERQIQASQFPFQRADRRAKVTSSVTQLWLEGYRAQNTIALIENNRSLFEQLADIAQANYASAARRTRQQDIVRAQLELTQLEDRLAQLYLQHDAAKQRLGEWLSPATLQQMFPAKLPDTNNVKEQLLDAALPMDRLAMQLTRHPAVLAIEKQVAVADTGVELAKQSYKPEWGVMASYGYRDDAPTGMQRADFLSLGISFDVPIFTGKRQDKQVSAATASAESVKTQRLLLLREMSAQVAALQVKLQRTQERKDLFENQLLPQMHEQAEAALTAYTNDDGDFAEVMRARIAELNTEIELLNITVEKYKLTAQLNYFLTESDLNGSVQKTIE